MIFRMISMYRKTKKGLNDPVGFAGEEVRDAYAGIVIVPGIILLAVIIILGILSFTHLIAKPSLAAQIFFWIFIIVGMVYATFAAILGRLVSRAVALGERKIRDALAEDETLR